MRGTGGLLHLLFLEHVPISALHLAIWTGNVHVSQKILTFFITVNYGNRAHTLESYCMGSHSSLSTY